MSQPTAAADFEAALLGVVRDPKAMKREPALDSLGVLLTLLKDAAHPNHERAEAARAIIGKLQRAYEYVRLQDDNWTNLRKSKRVTRFKPEYLPDTLADVRGLAERMWPLLPFVSFLSSTRNARAWRPRVKAARLYEYTFVLLCTKPLVMRSWLYALAAAVISRKRGFPHLDANDAAEAVVASFERRRLPVARYKAKAKTIEDAAKNVRIYMVAAIKRRVNDEVRRLLEPEIDVAASTQRRWKKKLGVGIASPDAAAEVRASMSERQKHVPSGRFSIARMAKAFNRSRSTVLKTLRMAEARHGFTAERGTDGTFWTTPNQARQVSDLLPPRRRKSSGD